PFPREYHARLIENLEKAGVKQIIFDIEFTEKTNPTSDELLARTAGKYKNIILAGKLIKTIYNYSIREQFLSPIKLITQKGVQWGTVNISADGDGFVRRYELFQKRGKQIKLSIGVLSLANCYKLLNFEEEVKNYPGLFKIGGNYIPKVTSKSSLINYCGPSRTFSTYDYADVIDDSTFTTSFEKELETELNQYYDLAENFKDKIVLIGLTSVEFHDTHHTPFFTEDKQLMAGVEIHANFIEMALQKDYLTEFSFVKYLIFFFLVSFILFFIYSNVKPSLSIFLNVFLIIGYLIFSYYLFTSKSLLISPLEIPTLIIVVYVVGLVFQYIKTVQERKFIKQAFGHYIAPELVNELIKDPKKLEYGGVQKELTVLFSDIVSFTPYTESHSPKETVDILREYLTEMVEIVTRNKGTLDKFVGDEIIAIFGAPVDLEDHAFWACKAALEMRERLNELHEKWKAEKRDPFEMGIGINSGLLTVGNLGSEQIFDYTAIGDNMNAGARVEALTRDYKTKNNIIISESTYQLVKDSIISNFIDETKVKGKSISIKIYELLGIKKEI
ncbi:MAG: adenylate/guanylate cyclase domain-containing protein, partial [Candidatus Cloacimonetes bacterium]|nr:adenylate/guanylate cyclase domain-containing protein [Candidatus Cloacimonadota bacterium]